MRLIVLLKSAAAFACFMSRKAPRAVYIYTRACVTFLFRATTLLPLTLL